MRSLADKARRHALALPALVLAVFLKDYNREATAEGLRWILGPTSWLTGLFLRADFAFYPGEGYLSREHSVLVTPACAGVNFSLVAFLSLVLAFGPERLGWRRQLSWLLASGALAYASAIVASAIRISASVTFAPLATRELGLTFQSVHRLIGIVVYVAALVTLCLTVRVWLSSRRGERVSSAPGSSGAAVVLAVLCYAGVTVGIPLLRGAPHHPDYWPHAAAVSVLVGLVLMLVFAARGRNWNDGRYACRPSERIAPQPGAHR